MRPEKSGAGAVERLASQHQRLYRALNIAARSSIHDGKCWEWNSMDIEIQRNVVRSISSFLDCISRENRYHPLFKDSISDIIGALQWILKHSIMSVVDISIHTTIILLKRAPFSILEQHMVSLVDPLLCNLCYIDDDSSSLLCGKALNVIISNIRARDEKEVGKLLQEKDIAGRLFNNLCRGFTCADYFKEMILLLGIILNKWPSSRYAVVSQQRLMNIMHVLDGKNDNALSIAVFKFYAGLVLCKNGAKRVLESGEKFVPWIVQYMGKSFPNCVRVQVFRLARSLVRREEEWLTVKAHCCDPFLGSIIDAMGESSALPNNVDLLPLEASRTALVLRFDGSHHDFFWNRGIDTILLTLLFGEVPQHQSSFNEQIIIAKKLLKEPNTSTLRASLVQIFAWLATHRTQNLTSKQEHAVDFIIIFVCLAFSEGYLERKITARTALMCIHSPCKYISSKSLEVLSELLQTPKAERVVDRLLKSVEQSANAVLELAVYSALPHWKRHIIGNRGVEILMNMVNHCWNTTSETHTIANDNACCFDEEDWEGGNLVLLYCLIALSELVSSDVEHNDVDIVGRLKEFCRGNYSSGVKWYSSYILSFFGIHGFPSNIGSDIGRFLGTDDLADFKITIPQKASFSVHGVVLASRCPLIIHCRSSTSSKEVSLSSHVDPDSLLKLLQFLYSGVVETNQTPSKKLKILARHCSLHPLYLVLSHCLPKWGATWPAYTLVPSSAFDSFSDIVLEADSSKSDWAPCGVCEAQSPHVHAHRIVVASRCPYLRALLASGMQESQRGSVKVPVSLEATAKLVRWMYSDEVELPRGGCVWENMGLEEKKEAVEPYLELGWLGGFWVLEEVREISVSLVLSWVVTGEELALHIMRRALAFSIMEVVQVAACYLAPHFPQLRQSDVEDDLFDIIRCASVELSRKNCQRS